MRTQPPRRDDAADKVELADAVRRLIRDTRTTAVDHAVHGRAIDLLVQAAEILEAEQLDGPYWQTGLAAIEHFRLSNDPTGLFPFSPAMGRSNPLASHVDLSVGDDKVVHGTVTLTEQYNGPPFDTCHGGIIALIYDDLIGMAAMVGAGGGMTASLKINYRKPTPLFRQLTLTAWLESHDGRKFIAKGEMHCDGVLLTEAEGLFIRPKGFPPGAATG